MNYIKMFRVVGIMDNDHNFLNHCSFDIEHNCRKSSEALFGMIDEVYTDNDFKTDLSCFFLELKNFYKELGVNLGCLFTERYFTKEFKLNLCDNKKLEMKTIFNLNGYMESIFHRIWDIKLDDLFSDLQNKILILKRKFIVDSRVPEAAINFVLKSDELRQLSYFLIKTGFKYGFFWCLALNTLYVQLSEEVGNYLPVDWPIQLI